MSGHSKWHNIQKTKGAQDAKRAATFTKIAKELIVAVKEGGGITDPANNSRLATIITKAKAANMPNDNIKRCLEKAAGAGGGCSSFSTYEVKVIFCAIMTKPIMDAPMAKIIVEVTLRISPNAR